MLLILVLRSFSKQSSVSVDDYDQEFHDEAFENNWKKNAIFA
jgi:hypothetical protein